MLIKLAKAAFEKASWPITINTGRYMYPLANNLRNVAPPSQDTPNTYHQTRQAIVAVQQTQCLPTELSTQQAGRACIIL